MTDSALFIDTAGAKNLLQSMRLIANNLANMNSTAFHADYETHKARKIDKNIMQTHIMPLSAEIYTDLKSGPILRTDRDLDVAIKGSGFIAVQKKDGQMAYTRNGSLNISPEGLLVTARGDLVMGAGGFINIPPSATISINDSGVVSIQVKGEAQNTTTEAGRIMLVDMPAGVAKKGEDGLFYPSDQSTPAASPLIKLIPKSLEGSNVDAIRSLAELIDLSQQFNMHTKQMKNVEDNALKANRLLDLQS